MNSPSPVAFDALGLRADLTGQLDSLGYTEPTPIQAAAIPELLSGADLIGRAATGTGKTAAFALPILHALNIDEASPQALVLAPTRELASQVATAFAKYGEPIGARIVTIVGGENISHQLRALRRGAHVLVATPGRAVDHLHRGSLDLSGIATVVLDEADEMLDMGFADDLDELLSAVPERRQTVLFSATMPARVAAIAKKHQHDPVRIDVAREEDGASSGTTTHRLHLVQRRDKIAALARIVDHDSPTAMVFCRTRQEVDEVTAELNARGHRAEALHGGMDHNHRQRVMARLRDGSATLLIATDVAARGIDVDSLTHVINIDVPTAPEAFVHRVGRVGRAGRSGVAVTIADPRQERLISAIEREIGQRLNATPLPSAADVATQRRRTAVELVAASLTDENGDRIVLDLDADGGLTDSFTDVDPRAVADAALTALARLMGPPVEDGDIETADRSKGRRRDHQDGGGRGGRNNRRPTDSRRGPGGRGDSRGDSRGGPGERRSRPEFDDADTAYVHVNAGRRAGVRPSDLVGAIANDVGVPGKKVGPIRINDHYSVIGVPTNSLGQVINRLDTVRGKPVRTREFTR